MGSFAQADPRTEQGPNSKNSNIPNHIPDRIPIAAPRRIHVRDYSNEPSKLFNGSCFNQNNENRARVKPKHTKCSKLKDRSGPKTREPYLNKGYGLLPYETPWHGSFIDGQAVSNAHGTA